jgi:hypothetical protein
MKSQIALGMLVGSLLVLGSVTTPASAEGVQLLDTTPPARIDPSLILPIPERMNVSLEVLVDGRPLPTVEYRGKVYLPVPQLGVEYEIRVKNAGPRRIAAIVSVDGLSVITGEPAAESQPGYIVSPGGSVRIKGWRRNLDTVATFRFVDRAASYASRKGHPENVGVIGLIAVEEAGLRRGVDLERLDSAGPTPRAFRSEVGSIGTEYGPDRDSRAVWVSFIRSANKRTITLYYDTVEELRRAGVPVDRTWPNPFPGDPRFAPPPPE